MKAGARTGSAVTVVPFCTPPRWDGVPPDLPWVFGVSTRNRVDVDGAPLALVVEAVDGPAAGVGWALVMGSAKTIEGFWRLKREACSSDTMAEVSSSEALR